MAYSSSLINKVNSPLSYPDILGLYFGLTRFVGETNVQFLQRLYKSSTAIKDTSVKGLIDVISLNLNLDIYQAIGISGPPGSTIVIVPGILMLNNVQINMFNIAEDTYLEWLQLSELIAVINSTPGWVADLLVSDRSCLTLCKQSNLNLVVNEPVITTDLMYTVENTGLINSSVIFNGICPAYDFVGDNIVFGNTPVSGLTVTYQYITSPYNIISSDVNLVALSDTSLISATVNSSNVLGYQLRKAIQDIMIADGSYWTE